VVELLLSPWADVNAQGGDYGNVLQAASARGHNKVVELLLSKGADVNAQEGYYGNALKAASSGGHDKVVELLLSKGADVNAQGGYYGNALQAASEEATETRPTRSYLRIFTADLWPEKECGQRMIVREQ
jgi:ankyrin repeat protein